jgi:hypothetical protein
VSDTRSVRKPAIYQIRIRGRMDEDWSEWFDDMTLTHTSEGQTILTGPIADQAALHGTLDKILNLNLELVSIVQIEGIAEQSEADSTNKCGRLDCAWRRTGPTLRS